mmetsp:Transcript_2440/g.8579  ORF Transcript_2440/g.8579 Transcript_2440/m.8579 type:complete len:218 (-) Transcript_2440:579-1232(-)
MRRLWCTTCEGRRCSTVVQPMSCSAMTSSSFMSLSTCLTPSSPECARPHTTGLPMNTALAPSAKALITSVPRITPPSRYTSARPPTAETMAGSTSMVAGTVSSCRAPWLLTQMPSTPWRTASSASSGVMTPFTTILMLVFLRSHWMLLQSSVGSTRLATYDASPEPFSPLDCVPRLCAPPLLAKLPMVRCGGSAKRPRTSPSRRPSTGVSTVTARAV